jgi:hypothetical protein
MRKNGNHLKHCQFLSCEDQLEEEMFIKIIVLYLPIKTKKYGSNKTNR